MTKQIKTAPLTNSEKQKRYREKRKQNPERDAAYIAKESVRNSKRKTIDALSNREVQAQRKAWRKRQMKSRNAKQEAKVLEVPISVSPIASLLQDTSVQKKRGRQAVLNRRSQSNRDVPQLRKIHQLASIGQGVLKYRTVSCYCEKNDWLAGNFCKCHLPAQVVQMQRSREKNTKRNVTQPWRGQGIYSSTSEEGEDEPLMPKVLAVEPQQGSSSAKTGQDVVSTTFSTSIIEHGTCVLVELKASRPRAKTNLSFRYAAVCQGVVEDDGDIKVMYLKHSEKGVLFSIDERDQANISFDQILAVLPNPTLTDQGRRGLMYQFREQVDVFEKP